MWAQYQKTFGRMQLIIAIMTCAAFFATGYRVIPAAAFFVVMQVGAAVGAVWAVRIKGKLEPR